MGEAVFRLFVSSPGDVAAERARAEAVGEKLNAEFKDRARFDAVFWEDHFYSADKTFQDQIPEAPNAASSSPSSGPASARRWRGSSRWLARWRSEWVPP